MQKQSKQRVLGSIRSLLLLPSVPTQVLGESNINFGCTMLRLLFELTGNISRFDTVASLAAGAPDAASTTAAPQQLTTTGPAGPGKEQQAALAAQLPYPQLYNVMRYTDIWDMLRRTSALDTVGAWVIARRKQLLCAARVSTIPL